MRALKYSLRQVSLDRDLGFFVCFFFLFFSHASQLIDDLSNNDE